MSFIEKNFSNNKKETRTKLFVPPVSVISAIGADSSDILIANEDIRPCFDPKEKCILRKGGDILLDFGCELHGTFIFSVCNIKHGENNSAAFRICLGESVSEAMSDTKTSAATNDHAPREIYTELSYYSEFETNESGFRFARLTLLSPEAEVELKAAVATLIYCDIPYLSHFECSDETVTKIYDTAAYTAHLNLQDYLYDGIKRDRLVWIGDMHTEVLSLLSLFGNNEKVLSIIKNSLDSIRDTTPAGKNMNGVSSYSMWWVMIHFELYKYTGDISYLSLQKDYLSKLMTVLASYVGENGEEKVPPHRFLDWPSSGDKNGVHCGLHGLLCLALEEGAMLCRALDLHPIASIADSAANKLKNAPPVLENSKQAAALLSLSNVYDRIKANEYISRRGDTGSTADGYSCFFAYYILTAKALAGDIKTALADMKEYFGAMLDLGATTFWEDFSLSWIKGNKPVSPITRLPKDDECCIHRDFGGYCYKGLRHSLCHGWSSGAVPFITRYILGVGDIDLKNKRIKISPNLADLGYIKGTVPTPLGTVYIEAHNIGGEIKTDITLPEGVTMW